jgi:pimeloyl-ACP methyl ester carboxylesterase
LEADTMSERHTEPLRCLLPEGGALSGKLSYAGSPGPAAVLFIHGFGSTHAGEKAAALEAACARRGWTYAAFDFRGHGASPGTLLELRGSALQADLEQVRASLSAVGVRTLFLAGSSMGGWAGAWFALHHPEVVPACVGIAPALRFLERRWSALDDEQRGTWRDTGRLRVRNEWLDVEVGYGLMEEREQFDADRLAAEWSTPLLIVHGLCDDSVPCADSLDFVQKVRCPEVELHLYKDGDHRLLAHKDDLAELACAFFARRWPGP